MQRGRQPLSRAAAIAILHHGHSLKTVFKGLKRQVDRISGS